MCSCEVNGQLDNMVSAQRYWATTKLLVLPFILVSILSGAFFLLWDEPLALYFENNVSDDLRSFLGTVTEMANGGIWYGLAVLGLVVSTCLARRRINDTDISRYQCYIRSWTYMLVSMAVAAALLNILKFAIGRYRPRYLFNEDLAGFEPFGLALKMASFPSGHAQSIWSAMVALCFLTPKFSPLYITAALLVSASRFLTAVHFVSDVIFGSFLSIAVAILIRQWFEREGHSVRLSAH